MKRKNSIVLLLLLLAITQVIAQSEVPSTMDYPIKSAELPSEETLKEMEQMSGKPTLRYAPGEWGSANKETPLPIGDSGLSAVLSLLGSYIIYMSLTKKKLNKKTK